ncbi:MAG: helix-turn-helix transcriptional regulator [Eubacteriales bacterium]|nr:helix-turn-helix transcriptional regulator [Eubacteriales bacterium]
MEIYDRIKILRKELGLTQPEFGKKLGINRDVVANIENNRLKNPQRKEPLYRLICDQFGVNESWLRTGDGEMFVQLSRDGEIAAFVGDVLSGESDSFKKRLISALSQLDEPEWELLESLAVKIVEKNRIHKSMYHPSLPVVCKT